MSPVHTPTHCMPFYPEYLLHRLRARLAQSVYACWYVVIVQRLTKSYKNRWKTWNTRVESWQQGIDFIKLSGFFFTLTQTASLKTKTKANLLGITVRNSPCSGKPAASCLCRSPIFWSEKRPFEPSLDYKQRHRAAASIVVLCNTSQSSPGLLPEVNSLTGPNK